jgi:hypothetical protein
MYHPWSEFFNLKISLNGSVDRLDLFLRFSFVGFSVGVLQAIEIDNPGHVLEGHLGKGFLDVHDLGRLFGIEKAKLRGKKKRIMEIGRKSEKPILPGEVGETDKNVDDLRPSRISRAL